jgi:hypothetical protein
VPAEGNRARRPFCRSAALLQISSSSNGSTSAGFHVFGVVAGSGQVQDRARVKLIIASLTSAARSSWVIVESP